MTTLRKIAVAIVILTASVFVGTFGYSCGQRSRADQLATLSQALSQTEQTVRLKEGLYQTTLVQVGDARKLLELRESENADLLRTLDAAKARVLTTERVVVKWLPKESAVEATQRDVPSDPGQPPVTRKRVDFKHDFGPFLVAGYTLTDPATGFVTVTQGRPLSLTLAVSRDPDGHWLSHVSSSDPDVGVDVTLGGVDPGILESRWYQRFWLSSTVGLLGGTSVGLGIEYRGERFSLGPQCQLWSDGHACGVGVGVRLFR